MNLETIIMQEKTEIIKAEELRIGNILSFQDEAFFVDGIPNMLFVTFSGIIGTPIPIRHVKPVIIEHEILIRLGFDGYRGLYHNKNCEVGHHYDNVWYIDDGIRTLEIELRYVHELQNIHYYLFIEELRYVK